MFVEICRNNKIEAEKLSQTSEGQVQLLQHALEQAQSGAKMDLKTQQRGFMITYKYEISLDVGYQGKSQFP